jgi:hypothetical protein
MQSMDTKEQAPPVAIPFLLDFDHSRLDSRGAPWTKPGRGSAGWTVARIPAEDAAEWLRALPRMAWMPGTHRVAAQLKVTY